MTLSGVVLSVTGNFDRQKISSVVRKAGCRVDALVHKKVNFVIADEKAVQMNTQRIRKARKFGIPVVSETFLLMCIKAGKLVDHTEYLLEKVSKQHAEDPVASLCAAPEVRETQQKPTKAAKKTTKEHSMEDSALIHADEQPIGMRSGGGAPEHLDMWAEILAMRLRQLSALRKMPFRERFRNRGMVRRGMKS